MTNHMLKYIFAYTLMGDLRLEMFAQKSHLKPPPTISVNSFFNIVQLKV